MSIARHHAEWLSLIETSGPFLSLPVLVRVFPQGLDARDADVAAELRQAYAEWDDNRAATAIHSAWGRYVLENILGFPTDRLAEGQAIPPGMEARFPEYAEVIRPDLALLPPADFADAARPRLLICTWPSAQGLEKPVAGRLWKATPATRMAELLRAADVKLGLLTNGEEWMLVHAPRGETAGFASWYASIWHEETLTLQAFCSLLHFRRFFGVGERDTLGAMLAESAQDQQELTSQLGWQVRKAVEVLIQALDRLDQDSGRKLLAGADEKQLYEAALTVMMRLVFLFSAEERGLLLLGDALYDQCYAVSTLRESLRDIADKHGEEILERRYDAWCRLLATFRAVHGGVEHDTMRMPPRGGTLFDPDRFPFLEGRQPGTTWRQTRAEPLRITNRTVLHLLEALQVLQVKMPGGGQAEARRISFKGLDITNIGHVYEGLLDHTAVRATEPILGLKGAKDQEPEVPLARLHELQAKSDGDLVAFLKDETGRSEAALRNAVSGDRDLPDTAEQERLLTACANDAALREAVLPFLPLLRPDTFGFPVVIRTGGVYVTQGTDRRSSGTHYTPRSLTEPMVRYALEPLVYHGPAEGLPREQWELRSAKEIMALRICDITMGSGALLVQVCRYVSERLVEAWQLAEEKIRKDQDAATGPAAGPEAEPQFSLIITPDGELSVGHATERLVPRDPEERLAIARRCVVDRCLYGVDINPMAVEMAKLSLWLITMQKDRPFGFLDHALRCGDSLLGLYDIKQVQYFDFDPKIGEQHQQWWEQKVFQHFQEAIDCRRRLEALPSETIDQIRSKEELARRAKETLATVRTCCDHLVAARLGFSDKPASVQAVEIEARRQRCLWLLGGTYRDREAEDVAKLAVESRGLLDTDCPEKMEPRRPFHWPVEFPEIFAVEGNPGFHAFVGNPPFMGGKKITGNLGTNYRDYMLEHLANGQRGCADLCAYFFLRTAQLLRVDGMAGLLATNTIAQGDTREVGLDQLVAAGMRIPRAVPSRRWPGTANLEVAHVWFRHGGWRGESVLDDKSVTGITSFLTEPGATMGKPFRLKASAGKSFQGSVVLGMGFVLEPDEALALIAKDPKNRDVLFPYLNGEDLNSRPDQSPSRWVINFLDWPLSRSVAGSWENADEDQRRDWLRSGEVPADYSDPVATDYPDCYRIVEGKVKPERAVSNRALYKDRWWRFAERCPGLYTAIAGMERVLVVPLVSKHSLFTWVIPGLVYSHALGVIAGTRGAVLAVTQSTQHEVWARESGSTLETRMRYTPTDCFETFPFPAESAMAGLKDIGERYYAHRQTIMQARQEGLTKTYNRFHDPDETAADIQKLRDLHVEMDQAVAAAYGWTDLDLGHGFHQTKQGLRFTISEPARREVLARLLKLNHERHAEEERQAAQATLDQAAAAGPKKRRPRKPKPEPEQPDNQGSLF